MVFVSSHTKPQNRAGAQQANLRQAAEAELQEPLQKISDRHPEEQGLAVCQNGPAGILSWGSVWSELYQLTKKLYETLSPSSRWGTNLAGDNNPCPTVGQQLTAATP